MPIYSENKYRSICNKFAPVTSGQLRLNFIMRSVLMFFFVISFIFFRFPLFTFYSATDFYLCVVLILPHNVTFCPLCLYASENVALFGSWCHTLYTCLVFLSLDISFDTRCSTVSVEKYSSVIKLWSKRQMYFICTHHFPTHYSVSII